MIGNVTVQSIDFVDVVTSYTVGLDCDKVKNYYTKPAGDTQYTATSVIIYEDNLGNNVIYGVSQSVATLLAAFGDVTQTELDAVITGIGANADGTYNTPSGTNNLDATTSVMDALDELDVVIGADVTPVARTNNPIIAINDVNTNTEALDAAIGTDAQLTVVTRTTGQLVVNSTVMTKFDTLDAGIGFDAQLSATPKLISKNYTVYQNLDKLDTYASTRVIKKTIGGVGVVGCDFNFATAADQIEQVINLGALIPAKARIVDFFSFTDTDFTGAVSLGIEFGTTSSGAELKASANLIAANTISQFATGGAPVIDISGTAKNVYASATPGANWSLVTAGKISIYITINDVTNV